MVNGSVYVIIHMKDFPNGEMRGKSFVGLHRLFPDSSDIKWDWVYPEKFLNNKHHYEYTLKR